MSCLESQSGLTEPCSLLLLPMASHCSCTGKEMMLSAEISSEMPDVNTQQSQQHVPQKIHKVEVGITNSGKDFFYQYIISPPGGRQESSTRVLVLTWRFEGDLALLAFSVVSNEGVSEEVGGDGSFQRVWLEATQNEGLGLQRQRLWDFWVDFKHPHLQQNSINSHVQCKIIIIPSNWCTP